MNRKFERRFVAILSTILVVSVGIWLAVLTMAHADMMPTRDCGIQVSMSADCAQSPDHVLHVLAHRLDGVSFSIVSSTPDSQFLVKILTILSLSSLAVVLFGDASRRHRLRRSLRFREFLRHLSLARFWAWRVTIQELHPSCAH